MSPAARAWTALATLAAILAITAAWWALALWPVDAGAPDWFVRTRDVCFGSDENGLPNAGGWILLVGQPAGMLGVLLSVWGADVRTGLRLAGARVAGQLALGVALACLVAGLSGVVVRVRGADAEPFYASETSDVASQLTRVNDAPPAMSLVDQDGRTIELSDFRGRPVIVTFAYAHCETVCPLVVSDAIEAQRQTADLDAALLVVTLDPWRDTPSRLPSMARQWRLRDDAHVLSGSPLVVERALNAWRVPRVRNEKTGELSHPAIAYVLNAEGRITYAVPGSAAAMAAAVRSAASPTSTPSSAPPPRATAP
jgi:protein SCO1/2